MRKTLQAQKWQTARFENRVLCSVLFTSSMPTVFVREDQRRGATHGENTYKRVIRRSKVNRGVGSCMPLSQRGTPEVSDTKISLCACSLSLFFSFNVCLFIPAPGLRDIVENFECLRILYIRWTATHWAIYQSRVSLHQARWWKYSLNRFRQRTQ